MQVYDPYKEEIAILKITSPRNLDGLELKQSLEVKFESSMLSIKLIVAFDFGGRTLPDSLVSAMDEIGKVNNSHMAMDISMNESIANDISKSTPSIKTGL
jgi:hypothetical protein